MRPVVAVTESWQCYSHPCHVYLSVLMKRNHPFYILGFRCSQMINDAACHDVKHTVLLFGTLQSGIVTVG